MTNEPKSDAKKSSEPIRLNDLLPRQNVKGGKGKPATIFGSLNGRDRNRRSASGL